MKHTFDKKNNEEGIALITSLMLAFVVLVMIAAILVITLTGIRTSAAIKRYTNALEAAKGATEDVLHDILAYLSNSTLTGTWKSTSTDKIENSWSTAYPTSYKDIVNYYDWRKAYGNYDVYAMITNTYKKKVFTSTGTFKMKYYYTIEIVSVNRNSPDQEKAWLSVFYQVSEK